MNKLNSSGNSGDEIRLISTACGLRVLKKIKTPSDRFNASVKKQQNFEPMSSRSLNIYSCPIDRLKLTDTGNISEIEMPYLYGFSGKKILKEFDFVLLGKISEFISAYIDGITSASIKKEVDLSIFFYKLEQVREATTRHRLIDPIHLIEKNLYGLPEKIPILAGRCHGDLTFENFKVDRNGNIYLFDFLATYFDSPFQDIAKLEQELVFGWSARDLNDYESFRANQIYSALIRSVDFDRYRHENFSQMKLFSLLNLARIAPYVTTDRVEAWLIKSIYKAVDIYA